MSETAVLRPVDPIVETFRLARRLLLTVAGSRLKAVPL
jgi:hypothetical protein